MIEGRPQVLNAIADPETPLDVTAWRGYGRGGFGPAKDLPASNGRGENPGSPERLTASETEVASLLASGYTDREIATMLGIGRRTVETHAANVRAKLGFKSRRELVRRGVWPAA